MTTLGFKTLGGFKTLALKAPAFRVLSLVLASSLAVASPILAEGQRVSKDVGPSNAACDQHGKGTAPWAACVGRASHAMADEELFYAGYWLAKSGHYEKALSYLALAQNKDERVLTYMGFATRKLGHVDEALPLYRQALAVNPNYVVARAYLGEAFLSRGEPERARSELAEIERRCGATCPPYVDLKGHIQDYDARVRKG